MDVQGCMVANELAKALFEHQQGLLPKIDDSFTAHEQVEILIAATRMFMATTYRALSCGKEEVLDFLISGTEESLQKAIEGIIPPKENFN